MQMTKFEVFDLSGIGILSGRRRSGGIGGSPSSHALHSLPWRRVTSVTLSSPRTFGETWAYLQVKGRDAWAWYA